MNTTGNHSDSLFVAMAGMTVLVTLRIFIFRWVAQSRKRSFHVTASLRRLLQVFGSFLVPGLGQATQGRFEAATLHVILFGVLWLSIGWLALPVQIASALECVRK